MGQIEWEEFKCASLNRFFLIKLRESKVQEFKNLRQGQMSVGEHFLEFTQLSKYAPFMVVDARTRMSKFISDMSNLVLSKCQMDMHVKEMDISYLMTYEEKIEKEKLREHAKESKKAWMDGGGFSHQRSEGHRRLRSGQRLVNQRSTNTPPKFNKNKRANPNPQGGSGAQASPNCSKYENKAS